MGKRKLLANVAVSVLLYGAPIWADAINARQYWRTEKVSSNGRLREGVSVPIAPFPQRQFAGWQVYPDRDSRRGAQEGIQRYTSGQTEECKSAAGQA